MTPTDGFWKRRRVALALAMISLSGCATGGSEPGPLAAYPPVVEYRGEVKARAAEELQLLPEESAIAEMMGDYSVRAQARACV